MEKFKRVFFGFAIAAFALVLVPSAGIAKPAKTGGSLYGLYNSRYCEVFTVQAPEPPAGEVTVYNTVGLNLCPAEQFNAIDYRAVAASKGALLALPNGPRRWLIDAITNGKAGASEDISGLEMRQVGVLHVPSLRPAPYTELHIDRTTNWVFNKGRTVRMLVSPTGDHYALQAYTRTIDPTLTEKNLNDLGANPLMAIPEGWKFKTRKLKHKLVLAADGEATVTRDPVGGTYQKFRWSERK